MLATDGDLLRQIRGELSSIGLGWSIEARWGKIQGPQAMMAMAGKNYFAPVPDGNMSGGEKRCTALVT
jgi:hypothetical protein